MVLARGAVLLGRVGQLLVVVIGRLDVLGACELVLHGIWLTVGIFVRFVLGMVVFAVVAELALPYAVELAYGFVLVLAVAGDHCYISSFIILTRN